MKTVEVEVEIDDSEFLSEIDTDDLIAELDGREDYVIESQDWWNLYNLLSANREREAIQLMRQMCQIKTGRIIP